jgi:hypothetical protein
LDAAANVTDGSATCRRVVDNCAQFMLEQMGK